MTTPSLPKRYEVRSLLGEGGSGRVYRVQDSIRDRELALKLVTPAESAFLRSEFDTLRQIRHENLIQVFDWGTLPSGEAYYTMELIEGGDWSRRMGKPQTADDVRHILTGLLRGLAHLHCHGEIHGDLKPGNILLGAGGVVKITDTGMGGGTGTGSGMSGTPGYAAPEVWEGATPNVRSDLYSVGVMGYEALTGKHPFVGRTVRDVVSGQLEGWVPSPAAHGATVPADLERVLMRALDRQPGLRQGSADEFMEGFGVEDRIGEILGGKLVGRDKDIAEFEQLLYVEEPGASTLVFMAGEPGIGKAALAEELASRLLSRGGRAIEIDLASARPIEEQIRNGLGVADHDGVPSTSPHHALFDLAQNAPILLVASGTLDRTAANDLWGLARYLWALSLERTRASRVLILVSGGGSEAAFVRNLQIQPLSVAECDALINGMLGATRLEPELIARLHGLSGGNPGALRSAVAHLVERGLIGRKGNRWAFREAAQIHTIKLEAGANPWTVAWNHLEESGKKAMLAIALFRRPIPTARLEQYLLSGSLDGVLSQLLSKGWIRGTPEGWSPASDGVRQAVEELGTRKHRTEIATRVLRSVTDGHGSDDIGDLELRYQQSPDALERGLQAAERALARGDQRLAIEKLSLCLVIAGENDLVAKGRGICLRLAALLHRLGDEDGARDHLEREEYWADASSSPEAASRLHLLGQVATSEGDLEAARSYLNQALALASNIGNQSLLLRCHSDLAEMDWRHGDESSRKQAMARIQSVLTRCPVDSALRDERAALMYQLGAAAVVSGSSTTAIEMLHAGFALAESDYWKMRLANALGSALLYVGDSAGSMKWLDQAWSYAESSRSDSFKARILSNRGGWFVLQGRFAEAADQDRLSAIWARRFGSTFEYAAGCAGMAMCAIHLARYEEALVQAREAMRAARTLNDYTYMARAVEIEGLVNFALGRVSVAEVDTRKALAIVRERGYTVVKPRLEWLLSRILFRKGDLEESTELLQAAEAQLLKTRDAEDLGGVHIEMHLRRARDGNAVESLRRIEAIFQEAAGRHLVVVAVPAALAMSTILQEQELDDMGSRRHVVAGLEMAERSGMRELAWQLGCRLGVLAARVGDMKESKSRFTFAARVLGEIANDLPDHHRRSYLGAAHVVAALRDMDAGSSEAEPQPNVAGAES